MFDEMIVITAGMDAKERENVVAAFKGGNKPLRLIPLLTAELPKTVEEVVRSIMDPNEGPREEASEFMAPWPLSFFAVFPRSAIDSYIASFKQVMERRGVFASITPTNTAWTWTYLIEHLGEERAHALKMEARQNK